MDKRERVKKALKIFWEIINGKDYVRCLSVCDEPEPAIRESSVNVLVPKIEIERKHCPFYGFWNTSLGIILDMENDQCGLLNISNPCCMEQKGDVPCWDTCPFNTKTLEEISSIFDKQNIRICPREFAPEEIPSAWEGVKASDWFDYFIKI